MSVTLDIRTNGHPTEHGNSSYDVNADDTNRIATVPQQLGLG